jgi:DNA (cytosine-5)-methyltransferase 1
LCVGISKIKRRVGFYELEIKKMKILNLYACLGGNRYKWDEVTDVEVTAVELDPELARMYQERFPNDTVIVGDAHQYLLDHFNEFDFIWSSPPCPTHSRARFWGHGKSGKDPVYPDMKLYQEIILLQTHFEGKFVVENVKPYYKPLVEAVEIDRHLYWSNFKLPTNLAPRHFDGMCQVKGELKKLQVFHEIDLTTYMGEQDKRKIGRNMVDYEVGKGILKTAVNQINANNYQTTSLF